MPDAFEIALTEKITRMCVAKEGATTYYVDGTSGNDGANGLTWESAKKTIQAAVDIADSWADIYVKAGTYVEEVIISESYVSLLGEDRASTTIQAPVGSYAFFSHANNTTVSDFAVNAAAPDYALKSSYDYQRIQSCDFNRPLIVRGDFCVLDDLRTTNTIWLGGSRNVVSDCLVENTTIGFKIDDQFGTPQYNVWVRNEALNCTQGYHNKKYIGGSEHNTIAHNNFVSCATPLEDESANNSYFENYYSNHTNVDNGSGIAVAPYAFAGGSDPRPVIVRNGWLAQALSGVNGNNIANLSGREITGNTGAIAADAETVCSAVIGQSGKRSELVNGIIRGVQTLGAGEKATVRVYKYNGGTWDKVDDYDVTKNSGLEANIGHAGHNNYMKISILHDGAANATFTYAFIVKDMEA